MLGLRVVPALVIIPYIDNLYTIGKVNSSRKKVSPNLFEFKKKNLTHLEKIRKKSNNQKFWQTLLYIYLVQSISMHIDGI